MTHAQAIAAARTMNPTAAEPHAVATAFIQPTTQFADAAQMAARHLWAAEASARPQPVLWVIIDRDRVPDAQTAVRTIGQRLAARPLGIVPLDVWFFILGARWPVAKPTHRSLRRRVAAFFRWIARRIA